MNLASLIACKGFLNRCPPEHQQRLYQLLSRKEQLEIQQLPHLSPFERERLYSDLLDQIHPSWLAPYLRTLSEHEIRLFVSALNESQKKGLSKLLRIEDHLPELTSLAKQSFRSVLRAQLVANQTLAPLPFLPEHRLNFLLKEDSETLTKMVHFLGLHDLAVEMRQIIATQALKKIYNSLSQKEGDYLNRLLLHREPLVFKRLFLNHWDGSKEGLKKAIEERGLHRLAHALYFASKSLVWYLSRKLDMYQGSSLLKYEEKPTHERAEGLLADQIQKILSFLKEVEKE